MAYAHALIELEDGTRIQRGQEVSEEIPGYDELVEAGSIRDEEYDPAEDEVGPPEFVEVGGVRYLKANDGAETADVRA